MPNTLMFAVNAVTDSSCNSAKCHYASY